LQTDEQAGWYSSKFVFWRYPVQTPPLSAILTQVYCGFSQSVHVNMQN